MERFSCLMCAELWALSGKVKELADNDIMLELGQLRRARKKWYRHIGKICNSAATGSEICDSDDEVQAALNLGFKYMDIMVDVDWRDIRRRHDNG